MELNPISTKVRGLIDSGLSMEKICVAADLKYNTLKQMFNRNRVSKMVKLSLLKGNLITDQDWIEYEKWFKSEGPKRKKRPKRSKRDDDTEAEFSGVD